MREKPIIFSGPMVRAILDGRKTQTRRIVKPQPIRTATGWQWRTYTWGLDKRRPVDVIDFGSLKPCPYGQPGDRLWVRETGWQRPYRSAHDMREGADTWRRYYYDADGLPDSDHEQFKDWGFKRRPAIHMPRWASRLTLEVTGVRVERLQDISQQDVFREGLHNAQQEEIEREEGQRLAAQDCFRVLWNRLNAKRAPWASNPWVWVVKFRRIA